MKIDTPFLENMITEDVLEHHISETGDWELTEKDTCSVCKGSGSDIDDVLSRCGACDGTGIDYEFTYGMSGGKPFVSLKQNGLEAIKEVCKGYRENEMSLLERTGSPMQMIFMLPMVCRLELIASGVDVDEMEQTGNMRQLAREVYKRWGSTFMTTNATHF